MTYKLYNRIPETVAALKFTGNNVTQTKHFLEPNEYQIRVIEGDAFEVDVPTRHGMVSIGKGDWIVRQLNGEIDVFTSERFKKLFQDSGERIEFD